MGGLFISYRRQDAAAYAMRLYEDLLRRYKGNVFLDVARLEPGADFTAQLRQSVASSSVMLVLIGPQWLSATDARGRRRIDDPHDFIRTEIAAALTEQKPVVPVLVGGAVMPPADALPADVHGLVMRQAARLSDENWTHDVEQLVVGLDALMARAGLPPAPDATGPRPHAPRTGALPFLTRLAHAFDILVGRSLPAHTSTDMDAPSPSMTREDSSISLPATATAGRGHEIFVSYSSKDSALADRIVDALESRGRACWIAHRDIPPGVPSWAEPIVTAIASSRLMLVLLTEHSIPSTQVLREVTLADDEKIPLLGVSLDPAPLSPGLRLFFVAAQRLDLARLGPDDQVRQILPAVTQLLQLN